MFNECSNTVSETRSLLHPLIKSALQIPVYLIIQKNSFKLSLTN